MHLLKKIGMITVQAQGKKCIETGLETGRVALVTGTVRVLALLVLNFTARRAAAVVVNYYDGSEAAA